ncbi:MAG: hypothetical protein ABMA64_24165 [Myxococcota bacterium]
MTLLLSLVGTPTAHAATELYAWDWTRTHRFAIETQVQLPLYMWLGTAFNHQARITAFDLRLVTTCADADIEGRHQVEVTCTIDDVALSAAVYPADAGRLQRVLDEIDTQLTGAGVQLVMQDDGRLANIDLEGLDRRNPRAGRINENLRLIVTRGFAGLDLALPSGDEAAWTHYQSWLMRAPSVTGTSTGAEVIHREVDRVGGFATIVSGGQGVLLPGEGVNKYDTRMTSETVFDLRAGRISDRTWTVIGGPTPSSFVAQGTEGLAYVQSGRIVALTTDEPWSVGPSREQRLGPSQSAIIPWSIGMELR